jgi:hypothetical protein
MSTRTTAAAIAAIVVSAGAAHAEVNTRVEYQVSPALAETWSSSLNALPGDSIDIRIRVSYVGTQQPLGLGAVMYQPTVSNWDGSGPSVDVLAPIAVGFGDALPIQTPIGSVPDAPGMYGRMRGLARSANGPTPTVPVRSFEMGHQQVHNGVSYLRIAQSNVTNWQAGAASPVGSGGVESSQWSVGSRPANAQPFDSRLTDIVMYKFNITLSSDLTLRQMIATTPQELFAYWDSGFTQARARWIANTSEAVGSIRGEYEAIPAVIHVVPAPAGAMVLWGLIGGGMLHRRR